MPKWEEIRDDLFEAVIQVQPPLSKDQQAEVVRIMNERGHDMVWNAIRYSSLPPAPLFFIVSSTVSALSHFIIPPSHFHTSGSSGNPQLSHNYKGKCRDDVPSSIGMRIPIRLCCWPWSSR